MTEVIFAALIAIGGSAITLFLSLAFQMFREREQRAEHIFDEFFAMRIQAFQEIIRTVTELGIHNGFPEVSSQHSPSQFLESASKEIASTFTKTILCVPKSVYDILEELGVLTAEESARELGMDMHGYDERSIAFKTRYQTLYAKLIGLLREESGAYLVDRRLKQLLVEKSAKARNKMRRK